MASYYAGVPYNTQLRLSANVSYGAIGDEAAANVTAGITAARAAVARALGTSHEDVAFTKNATEALNLVAHGLPWTRGDEVLISESEHQSSLLPYLRAAEEFGLRLVWIRADECGRVDPADAARLLTPRTRLIALIHVSGLFGTVEPVAAVGSLAARHGVLFAVDAAQSAGRVPVNINTISCDFLTLSGHKALMGPQGIGALVGRHGSLNRLRPSYLGSRCAVIEHRHDGTMKYVLAQSPFHLEAGGINTSAALGLGASVAFLESLGWAAVFDRIQTLGVRLWNALSAIPSVQLYGDQQQATRCGIVSFNVDGRSSSGICEELWANGRVITSPGIHGSSLAVHKIGVSGTVRASVHCYNTEDEIDHFAHVLAAVASRPALSGIT
jgi:cysteine desulfurase/selenocysteine lyase